MPGNIALLLGSVRRPDGYAKPHSCAHVRTNVALVATVLYWLRTSRPSIRNWWHKLRILLWSAIRLPACPPLGHHTGKTAPSPQDAVPRRQLAKTLFLSVRSIERAPDIKLPHRSPTSMTVEFETDHTIADVTADRQRTFQLALHWHTTRAKQRQNPKITAATLSNSQNLNSSSPFERMWRRLPPFLN